MAMAFVRRCVDLPLNARDQNQIEVEPVRMLDQ